MYKTVPATVSEIQNAPGIVVVVVWRGLTLHLETGWQQKVDKGLWMYDTKLRATYRSSKHDTEWFAPLTLAYTRTLGIKEQQKRPQ